MFIIIYYIILNYTKLYTEWIEKYEHIDYSLCSSTEKIFIEYLTLSWCFGLILVLFLQLHWHWTFVHIILN